RRGLRLRFDVDAIPAPADAIAAQTEAEFAFDISRDDRTRLELLDAEASQGRAPRFESGVLVLAGQEALARPGRFEGREEGLVGHHLAARMASVELLHRPVQRGAVHDRVMGGERDAQDVPEL